MAGRGYLRQDYVEMVVGRLPDEVRREILEANNIIVRTQEEFRFLERRVPQKLGTVDAKELRAACLLEFVFREEKGSGSRLSTKVLAKSLGTSKSNFDKLHSRIGNFRGPGINTERCSQQLSSSSANNTSGTSTSTTTIPRLCFRLVSLLDDPNAVCLRAERLFEEMKAYVDTLKGARKKDQETDMKRFQAAYEAAILYHVVSEFSPRRLAARVTAQQYLKRRKQGIRASIQRHVRPGESQLLAGNNSDQEDEHTRPLEINDIVDASSSFTIKEFKPVLNHVEKLIQEMEDAKAKAAEKEPPKTTTTTSKAAARAKSKASNKKGKTKSVATLLGASKRKRAASMDSFDDDDDDEDGKSRSKILRLNDEEADENDESAEEKQELEVPTFQAWRQDTLADALGAARKELEETTFIPRTQISDSVALSAAADSVLRQFGILA